MSTEVPQVRDLLTRLYEHNQRTTEQCDRTRGEIWSLWELWEAEASALYGAEWELVDGRIHAMLNEELSLLATIHPSPNTNSAATLQPTPLPEGPWVKAQLLELLQHAAAHIKAQHDELVAALEGRLELLNEIESLSHSLPHNFISEYRMWCTRARDVVQRIDHIHSGLRNAHTTYLRVMQLNTRLFQTPLCPELSEGSREENTASQLGDHPFYGQLSPSAYYALANLLVAVQQELLTALISLHIQLEKIGPLVGIRQHEWSEHYDQRADAVCSLAGECAHSLQEVARSLRQAARNWEITEFNAGEARGVLPPAHTVKEVMDVRLPPPPSAHARRGTTPLPMALTQGVDAWSTFADSFDTLETAVIAANGYDSLEAVAVEGTIHQLAVRLYAVQDGAHEISAMCSQLASKNELPWWKKNRFSQNPVR